MTTVQCLLAEFCDLHLDGGRLACPAQKMCRSRREAGKGGASTPSLRLSTRAPTGGRPIFVGTEESALLPRLLPIPIVALASLE